MYPKTVFVRIGNSYTEVDTKSAYLFASIRKKLSKAWNVGIKGPSIDAKNG